MPGYRQQVPGGVASYEAYIQTMPPWAREETILWDRRWTYQRRSPDNAPQWDYSFLATGAWWPMVGSGAYSDPGASGGFFGGDSPGFHAGSFDGWHFGLGGSQTQKYIVGICKDQNGTPLPGAVVQGFRTSDDMFVGETACNAQGTYELNCPQTPNDQHYLVAYYASGNLAGTTVNTLVPAWRIT